MLRQPARVFRSFYRNIYLSGYRRASDDAHVVAANSGCSESRSSPLDVLSDVSLSTSELNCERILSIFNDLYQTHRETPCDYKSIMEHPSFEPLCDEVIEKLGEIPKPGDLISMVKTLVYMNLPLDTRIAERVLSKILVRSCALELNEILLLSNLLRKSTQIRSRSEYSRKLEVVLPMVYQIKYMDSVSDKNCLQLTRILQFMSYYPDRFSAKAQNGIFAALIRNEQHFDVTCVMYILRSLEKLPYHSSQARLLIKNAVLSLGRQDLNEQDVNFVDWVLQQFEYGLELYGSGIFEKITDLCVERELPVQRCFSLLETLNRKRFYSTKLIDYIAERFEELPDSIYTVFNLAISIANTNHKPPQWNDVVLPRISRMRLSEQVSKSPQIDWPLFALTLSKLGYVDDVLTEEIVAHDTSHYSSEAFKQLENVVALTFNTNLGELLRRIIGEDKLLSNVRNKYGATADYVLKINQEGRTFVSFEKHDLHASKGQIIAEDIRLDKKEHLIAIVTKYLDQETIKRIRRTEWTIQSIDRKKFVGKSEFEKTSMILELFKNIILCGASRGTKRT